jgi:hypothetical protein
MRSGLRKKKAKKIKKMKSKQLKKIYHNIMLVNRRSKTPKKIHLMDIIANWCNHGG